MAKKFKKHKYILLAALFRVVKLFDFRRAPGVDPAMIERILLVTTTAIGDTLMSTPAIRAVKKTYPRASVFVMVHGRTITLLEGNPYVEELISYPGKFKKFFKMVRGLMGHNFDLAIVLHANDPDIVPMIYLAGIPRRVGWKESRFSFLFTQTYARPDGPEHLIKLRLNTAEAAGAEPDGFGMDLVLNDQDRLFAANYLAQNALGGKTLIGVHPFGSHGSKRWDHFPGFVNSVSKEIPGAKVVVISGKNEAGLLDRYAPEIKGAGRDVFLIKGEFTLRQSSALIERCACFVTTDSGPMHIALALRVPTVVLGGPTDLQRTGPLDCGRNIVIQKEIECKPCDRKVCEDNRCMEMITAQEVLQAVKKAVEGLPAKR